MPQMLVEIHKEVDGELVLYPLEPVLPSHPKRAEKEEDYGLGFRTSLLTVNMWTLFYQRAPIRKPGWPS